MKRLILLTALFVLVFAANAWADTTATADVDVTVQTVRSILADGDFAFTISDPDAASVTDMQAVDLDWTSNVAADDIDAKFDGGGSWPGDWYVHISDDDGTTWLQLSGSFAEFLTDVGGTGSGAEDDVDGKLTGFDWGDAPGAYDGTVTFQIAT